MQKIQKEKFHKKNNANRNMQDIYIQLRVGAPQNIDGYR